MKANVRARNFARRAARAAKRRVHTRITGPSPTSVGPAGDFRLVPQPVFVLSYMRSGSTLLRVILNSHSQICAPLEMHLRALKVEAEGRLLRTALKELGLTTRELENMLWDRILFDRLIKDGKKLVVDKTPANALGWRRIHNYWPEAKFIILYRHPVRILGSWQDARPDISAEKSVPQLLKFTEAMEQARTEHGGLVVKYEDLTREPARTTQQICQFLGVPWEPQMVEYGQQDHGRFVRGLGDWSEKINSGKISPAPPDPKPEDVPDELKEICRLMGYL
jgi:hypothetical protein